MLSHPLEDNLVEEIKSKIKQVIAEEHYEKIDPSIINDLAKIGAYLRSVKPEELAEGFKDLSDELENRYKELGMIEEIKNEDGSISKRFIKNTTKIHPHKVFTTVIENWAKENGLNQGAMVHCIITEGDQQVRKLIDLPGKIPTIFGFIKPSVFRGLLSLGYLLKDVGAGKNHGEFTHLLTIYLIIKANKLNPFLDHNPVELYKMLGDEIRFNPDGEVGYGSIWNILFDEPFQAEINNRPEQFSKLIRFAKNASIQILSDMLSERFKKREKVDGSYSDVEKELLSGKKAAEKCRNAPGVLLDEKIFFSLPYSESQVKVQYDEVTDVCHYDVTLEEIFPLPNIDIDKDSPLLDQIIARFNVDNWQNTASADQNTRNLAIQIHDKFLQMKKADANTYIPHRKIAETLEELTKIKITYSRNPKTNKTDVFREESVYRTDKYINFLINHSKKILLDYDLEDTVNNLTQKYSTFTDEVNIESKLGYQ